MIHLPSWYAKAVFGPHPSRIHALVMPWKAWRSSWSRREKMGGYWFPLEIFLVGLLCIAVPYFASNNIAEYYLSTVWDPEIALDRDIPVINWMIIPYTALYLFYPATLVLSPRDDRGRMELLLAMQGLILITLFCVAIFLVLPAEIDLRWQLDEHWADEPLNGFESALYGFIHFSDNPWNAWPSLHIVHSYLLARMITLWVSREHGEKPLARAFLGILWIEYVLLCISILTTKQHYLFDLATGLIVAMLAWRLFEYALAMPERHSPGEIAEEAGWA